MVGENLNPVRPWAGLLLVWGAALMLPACSAAPGGAGGAPSAGAMAPPAGAPAMACDARLVQDLVGQHPSSLIAEGARQRAGAQRVRMIGHDEMVTKEFDPGRLNLQLDAQGRVASVYCG